jgi:6,7-dimethyl-8-ribityllumazine synthase
MPQTVEGHLKAKGLRFAIVASRFNELVSRRLIEGATDCLIRHEVTPGDIDIVIVPGVMEIPPVVKRIAGSGKIDAVIALGTVIRGDTPHFEFVARGITSALTNLNLEMPVPVIYGVLTSDNLDQALDRSGAKHGNRGWHAALAAIEMANLNTALDKYEKKK